MPNRIADENKSGELRPCRKFAKTEVTGHIIRRVAIDTSLS